MYLRVTSSRCSAEIGALKLVYFLEIWGPTSSSNASKCSTDIRYVLKIFCGNASGLDTEHRIPLFSHVQHLMDAPKFPWTPFQVETVRIFAKEWVSYPLSICLSDADFC